MRVQVAYTPPMHHAASSAATPTPRERVAAALMALCVIALGAIGAHACGMHAPPALLLLAPFALVLAPAGTVSGIVGSIRRGGLLATALLAAIRTAAAACSELIAGATLLALGALTALALAGLAQATQAVLVSLSRAALSARDVCARLRAQLGIVAATLSARTLPAPRFAAHTAA